MIRKLTTWYLVIFTITLFLMPLSVFAGGKKENAPADKNAVQTSSQKEDKAADKPVVKDSKREPIKTSNEIAAEVNGIKIPMAKFTSQLQTVLQQYASQGVAIDDSRKTQLRQKVLDNLIGQELLYQDAEKKGIKVSKEDVDTQLDGIKKQFKDDAEYQNALKSQGITEDFLKGDIKMNIALNKYIDKTFKPQVTITDAEDAAFYGANPQYFSQPEQIRASHILIKVPKDADAATKAAARKKIEDVQKKLKGGAKFSDLAKKVSEGPSSKNGGDLGYFGKGQMVKPFEDAAFALKKGEMSNIVETQFGYHIIKLTDRKAAGLVPYDKVKKQIQDHLFQVKLGDVIQKYIDTLKTGASIKKFIS